MTERRSNTVKIINNKDFVFRFLLLLFGFSPPLQCISVIIQLIDRAFCACLKDLFVCFTYLDFSLQSVYGGK